MTKLIGVFVPSRGFLFFYGGTSYDRTSSAIWFSSPHGDFSFSICITGNMWIGQQLFSSPHGDFSFSIKVMRKRGFFSLSFRPLTGISLFLYFFRYLINPYISVFVPSRGFLFFYVDEPIHSDAWYTLFSSPHGDFSFSMVGKVTQENVCTCFRPLTGISLFLSGCYPIHLHILLVFVPSRGFLFFYGTD